MVKVKDCPDLPVGYMHVPELDGAPPPVGSWFEVPNQPDLEVKRVGGALVVVAHRVGTFLVGFATPDAVTFGTIAATQPPAPPAPKSVLTRLTEVAKSVPWKTAGKYAGLIAIALALFGGGAAIRDWWKDVRPPVVDPVDPPLPPNPPKPVDPAPVKTDGLFVLVIYESTPKSGDAQLTPAQVDELNGEEFAKYLDAQCPKIGGTPQYRIWDRNTSTTDVADVWKKAMALPREGEPWIIIANDKTGFSGRLPKGGEILPLIKKYEVKKS